MKDLKLSLKSDFYPRTILVGEHYAFTLSEEGAAKTAEGFAWHGFKVREDLARRIVACVNACDGVPTDVLENTVQRGGALLYQQERRKAAEAQRDELLAALELALSFLEAYDVEIDEEMGTGRNLAEIERDGDLSTRVIAVRSAIARAKGGAA